MPRNDQITRQWHLLRLLEGSQGRSLQNLVESVPDDYPKNTRTVRRDLEALEAVGFPLVVEKHNGQTRWRLMEGFRDIPALGFSATELMAGERRSQESAWFTPLSAVGQKHLSVKLLPYRWQIA
jgi:predicted DNA-binding transcriptional regulator YafY